MTFLWKVDLCVFVCVGVCADLFLYICTDAHKYLNLHLGFESQACLIYLFFNKLLSLVWIKQCLLLVFRKIQ